LASKDLTESKNVGWKGEKISKEEGGLKTRSLPQQ
jgi:hypothetical protein